MESLPIIPGGWGGATGGSGSRSVTMPFLGVY